MVRASKFSQWQFIDKSAIISDLRSLSCRTKDVPPIEERFEIIYFQTNAARIDFILTENGPKIIEINSQW